MTTADAPTDPGTDGEASTTRDRLVLTIAEAADVLGSSRAFAYGFAARSEIPILRLGRRRLVPRKALLAMVGEEATDGVAASATPTSPAIAHRLVSESEEGHLPIIGGLESAQPSPARIRCASPYSTTR